MQSLEFVLHNFDVLLLSAIGVLFLVKILLYFLSGDDLSGFFYSPKDVIHAINSKRLKRRRKAQNVLSRWLLGFILFLLPVMLLKFLLGQSI